MTIDQTSVEEKNRIIRDMLPFWAKELLQMKDDAERKNKVKAVVRE